MPSYSKNDTILVRYPFSDLSGSKVKPAIVVNAPHASQDIFIIPLTSKTTVRSLTSKHRSESKVKLKDFGKLNALCHPPFLDSIIYLEYPAFWSSFHTRLIVAIADAIEPQLSVQYYVDVESRTYQTDESEDEVLIGIPDAVVFAEKSEPAPSEEQSAGSISVATQLYPEKVSLPMPLVLKERYLEVREMGTDDVITVIELLSPANKRNGEGRSAYEKKRRSILGSSTHLVELDLLRGAKPMPMRGRQAALDYRIVVSRSQQRPTADLYAVTIRDHLPNFPIPLKVTDSEPIVLLQEVFTQVYDRARYAHRINYRQMPPPKLSLEDQQWVDELLAPLWRV